MSSFNEDEFDVVVIGGGSAGLQCARSLQAEHGIPAQNVLVLEARPMVGGRVHQTETFIPGHEVEMGAEFAHGSTTKLNEYVSFYDWELSDVFTWAQGDGGPSDEPTNEGGIGAYYLGAEKKMLSWDSDDKDFNKMNEILWELCNETPTKMTKHLSMKDHLISRGVSSRMLSMANAGYANTCGSSLDKLSYNYSCAAEKYWIADDDEGDYRPQKSFKQLLNILVDPQGLWHQSNPLKKRHGIIEEPLQIRTSTAVSDIYWNEPDHMIRLVTNKGHTIKATCVVVTVPLPILKDHLNFNPPLPQTKQYAANNLGIGIAAKLLIRLKCRGNIPDKLQGMICSDCFIPEIWFRDTPNGDVLVTCFLMDDFARRASAFGEAESINLALRQLDEMFPGKTMISTYFIQGLLHNWADVPYIRMGYTFCPVGHDESLFRELAKPLPNGQVMFAGEAYVSSGANMTIHSALDAGSRAAEETVKCLERKGLLNPRVLPPLKPRL